MKLGHYTARVMIDLAAVDSQRTSTILKNILDVGIADGLTLANSSERGAASDSTQCLHAILNYP